MMQQRLNGLKSRSDESRLQAAKDLQHYVSTELREASAEQYTSFMDELNHHIFEMVSSSDANEKKGGIMAIGEWCYDKLCSFMAPLHMYLRKSFQMPSKTCYVHVNKQRSFGSWSVDDLRLRLHWTIISFLCFLHDWTIDET